MSILKALVAFSLLILFGCTSSTTTDTSKAVWSVQKTPAQTQPSGQKEKSVTIASSPTVQTGSSESILVDSGAMEPTIAKGTMVKVSKEIGSLKRGDIIIFTDDTPENTMIKRIVRLPGEKVKLQNSDVLITNTENPSGFLLSEPYVLPANAKRDEEASFSEIQLKASEYYVLGDNRKMSSDSRDFGAVEEKNIIGKVILP